MSSKSFMSSIVLHGMVLSLMLLDFSFSRIDKTSTTPVLLMVDLNKLEISDKTNLPPKKIKNIAKIDKKVKETPKKTKATVHSTQVRKKKAPVPPKPIPQKPVQNAAQIIEKKKPSLDKKKEKIVSKKKEINRSKSHSSNKKKSSYDMKSLLASVEKIRKEAPQQEVLSENDSSTPAHEGIEGGTQGSFSQILTISERDLISNQIKKCWNVDAGAVGIDETIVEIRAYINKDGKVRDVQLLNSSHKPGYQTISESAVRAIWICDAKGDESPFKILAHKYSDHYKDWKEIRLRFNPMDGSIF